MQRLNRGNLLATIKELKKHKRPKMSVVPASVQAIVPSSSKNTRADNVSTLLKRRQVLFGGLRLGAYTLGAADLALFERLIQIQDISCTYDGEPYGELFIHWYYVERSSPRFTKCEIFHLNMFKYFSVPRKMSVIHIRLACKCSKTPEPVAEFVRIMESYGCRVDLKLVPQKSNWEHDTIMETAEYAVETGKYVYYVHFKGASRIIEQNVRSVRPTGIHVHPINLLYWCYIMYKGLFAEKPVYPAIGPIACNRINKEYLLLDLSWSTNPNYQYIGSFQAFSGVALKSAFERLGLDRPRRNKLLWWGSRYTVEMFLSLVFLENEVYSIAQMNGDGAAYKMFMTDFFPAMKREFLSVFKPSMQYEEPAKVARNNVAVCAMAKNEDLYLDEWISYYKNCGVEHIYLLDNNDVETAKLKELGKDPFVTVIPVRGRKALMDIGYQTGAYLKVYNDFGNRYDWFGFFDIDEFVCVAGGNIPKFLSNPIYHNTHVVHLHWRYYGDNNKSVYEPLPVQDRFSNPAPINVKYSNQDKDENRYVKSFIRTGYSEFIMEVHSPRFHGAVCRDTRGYFGESSHSTEDIVLDNAFVKHYGTKTIEEYIIRRIPCEANGALQKGLDKLPRATGLPPVSVKERLDWFFNVNAVTAEKLDVIKRMLPGLKYSPPVK